MINLKAMAFAQTKKIMFQHSSLSLLPLVIKENSIPLPSLNIKSGGSYRNPNSGLNINVCIFKMNAFFKLTKRFKI